MSLPLVLCFTGDTRLWRLPKESDGSLRPRTFRLDLGKEKRRLLAKVENGKIKKHVQIPHNLWLFQLIILNLLLKPDESDLD